MAINRVTSRFNRKLSRAGRQGMVPRHSERTKTPATRAYWATYGRQVWCPSYLIPTASLTLKD